MTDLAVPAKMTGVAMGITGSLMNLVLFVMEPSWGFGLLLVGCVLSTGWLIRDLNQEIKWHNEHGHKL